MREHRARVSRRSGFTLVELMVAMAASIIIMLIIVEMFKRGTDAFRTLKAAGDMQERLRIAALSLRGDLSQHHFSSGYAPSPAYLRDLDLRYSDAKTGAVINGTPPSDGFFRIYQGSMDAQGNPFIAEGTDRDGVLFTRATTHISVTDSPPSG